LRQVGVIAVRGEPLVKAVQTIGVTEATYDR
jgi:hypothetical protein